jgi:hypothetical protein
VFSLECRASSVTVSLFTHLKNVSRRLIDD